MQKFFFELLDRNSSFKDPLQSLQVRSSGWWLICFYSDCHLNLLVCYSFSELLSLPILFCPSQETRRALFSPWAILMNVSSASSRALFEHFSSSLDCQWKKQPRFTQTPYHQNRYFSFIPCKKTFLYYRLLTWNLQ